MTPRRIAPPGGRRVRLQAPGPEDCGELLALARRSRRLHRGWMAPPRAPADFTAYLDRLAQGRHAGFLLRRGEDDALLGLVNLNEIVRGVFQSAYLGYWIGEPFARQGYMTEGLSQVLGVAFGPLRLHRVEANIQPGNRASIALVERLGFRHEGRSHRYLKIGGRWRDHDRFALLAEEWRGGGRRAPEARLPR